MPFFSHDNLNFYFEEEGTGLPFVFSHGLGGSIRDAKELIGSVPGFRLIFYDNRGHGRTCQSGAIARLNFSTLADDAAALLNRLSISSAIVGGISMGAGIALAFCLKNPHRAQAAILVRPAWLNEPEPPNLGMFPAIATMIQEAGVEQARELFKRSDIYLAWKERYPPAANAVEGLFSGRSVEAIVATFRAIPQAVPFREIAQLKHVNVPALVLANRDDPVHPFEYARALATALPNAQLKEFPSKADGIDQHISCFRLYVNEFLRNFIS
jgi:pimeloyl-ACP methyl ester carboxylesterase